MLALFGLDGRVGGWGGRGDIQHSLGGRSDFGLGQQMWRRAGWESRIAFWVLIWFSRLERWDCRLDSWVEGAGFLIECFPAEQEWYIPFPPSLSGMRGVLHMVVPGQGQAIHALPPRARTQDSTPLRSSDDAFFSSPSYSHLRSQPKPRRISGNRRLMSLSPLWFLHEREQFLNRKEI